MYEGFHVCKFMKECVCVCARGSVYVCLYFVSVCARGCICICVFCLILCKCACIQVWVNV